LKLDSYAPLISAIDQGYIVADLKNKLITGPDSCLVSSSYALLEHGRELRSSQLIYTPDLVKPQSLSMVPTQKTAEEALNRLAEVNSGRSSRNIRRWKKRIKAGEKLGLSPFQSLVSLHHRCGENSVHLNSKVKDFLDGYLLNEHISKQGISTYRGHKYYQYLAKDVHPEYEPVCKKTFARHLSSIHPEVIGRARGGKRLGNSMALPSDPMERNLKAQVAWERAAIDHYCVDLYLIVYNKSGEVFVDRPWLTLMIDLFTGKVLAFSISFEKPSRRAVAKVLRACVRNHQKLPREIIFDRGAEFKSVYLASLLAHHSIILSLRPASHSRFGGEVEGFFGEFMKQWLSQREGNLAKFKEARSVDGKMAPRKKAVLSPSDFHKELSAFCKWRENKCRGTGSHSSEALFEQSSLDFPHIARLVEYDAEFIATTAIEAKQFTLDMQRGINVQGLWYSSPSMQLLIGKPKKNEVRIDPENPNLIFVKVIDQWVPFYGSEINTYSAKSSEHQIADGLIKHEATFLKRKIREQDDLSLAGLVHQMNQHHSTEDETHDLAVEQLGPSEDTTPKFSKLKKAIVRPVNRQEWRS
jgi:putative transposase